MSALPDFDDDVIVLSSGSEDEDDLDDVMMVIANDDVMAVTLCDGPGTSSASRRPLKRDATTAGLSNSDDDGILIEPSTSSSFNLTSDIFTVLSKVESDKRTQNINALTEEYGSEESGWGVKVSRTKVVDDEVISSLSLSVMPWLNKTYDPTDTFTVGLIRGIEPNVQQDFYPGYLSFPPIRVRVELSVASTDAKFFVHCSWLVKEHIKRIAVEMERRYNKHRCSLAKAFNWLEKKSIKFLQIIRHRRIVYVSHDVVEKRKHYITFHDPEQVHKMYLDVQTKLQSLGNTALVSAKTFDCPVCFDHKPAMAAIMFPGCKHFFCRACVSEDLRIKVREGQLKDLTCLENGCKMAADMDMIKSLVDHSTFERYCDLTTDQFVDASKMIIRCPKKECNAPMELIPNAQRELGCLTCGHKFCTTCRAAPHPNVPCLTDDQKRQIRDEWNAAEENGKRQLEKRVGPDNVKFALEDAESEEWIAKNAKPCPKCATPIQKIDGCNKMVCTSKGCRTYFCWLCGKTLPQADPYKHFSEPGGACTGLLHQAGNRGVLPGQLPAYAGLPFFPPPHMLPPANVPNMVNAAVQHHMALHRLAVPRRAPRPRRPPLEVAQERLRHAEAQAAAERGRLQVVAARALARRNAQVERARLNFAAVAERDDQRAGLRRNRVAWAAEQIPAPPRAAAPVPAWNAMEPDGYNHQPRNPFNYDVEPPPVPVVVVQPAMYQQAAGHQGLNMMHPGQYAGHNLEHDFFYGDGGHVPARQAGQFHQNVYHPAQDPRLQFVNAQALDHGNHLGF